MVSKLLDIDLNDNFLDLTPKGKATKVQMNKWDYIKLKSFSSAIHSMGENIFKSHIQQLLSKRYFKNSYNSTAENQFVLKINRRFE